MISIYKEFCQYRWPFPSRSALTVASAVAGVRRRDVPAETSRTCLASREIGIGSGRRPPPGRRPPRDRGTRPRRGRTGHGTPLCACVAAAPRADRDRSAASRIVYASSSLKPVPKRLAVALVYASKGFVTRQLAAHVGERDATIAVARA